MDRCLGCMELIDEKYEVCPHCGYVKGSKPVEAIHMEPGSLLDDRYFVGKVIGYGGFGVTYLGWDAKLEQKVAIKEYMPTEFSTRMPGLSQITVFAGDKAEQFESGMKKFIDEARKLAKFQNEEGIVKVFDSFESNNTAYIIMEYLDGENLSEYLKEVGTIPENDAIDMLQPVLESLKRVHEAGILHRDIAPDNIFITKDGKVKLIDFGASRYATTTHSRSLTVIVKPGYSPEEQYRSRGDQGTYTDVYSLSATIYKMITGKTPPDAMERRARYENQNKDILVEPHKLTKNITLAHENALLNALNVRIEDRTADIQSFQDELSADPPAKRRYGKIKKLDLYRWPLGIKIALPIIAAAIVTFFTLIFTGVIQFSRFSENIIIPEGIVQIPDVEGFSKSEATAMLEAAGLLVYYGDAIYTEYVSENLVVNQDPLSGYYIERGGSVIISTAYGKIVQVENHYATIPKVTDFILEDALARVAEAGLPEPLIEYIFDDYVREDYVCNVDFEEGSLVPEDTCITLYVSKGTAPFSMPDVYNISYADAVSTLESKGLIVKLTYVQDKNVSYGYVCSQSYAAGAEVKKGYEVVLGVSTQEPTISVPNVVGMDSKDAKNTLTSAGFAVTVLENYDANIPAGTVINQSPAAGTEQKEGDNITIFVSLGKMPITVTFDGNGGNASKSSITVYNGNAYGSLPSASRRGYTFAGWATDAAGSSFVSDGTIVTATGNHTLYAIWSGGQYTLYFDACGGASDMGSKQLNVDSAYGSLPSASRNGYTFMGWFTAASGGSAVSDSTKMDDHNVTVYAHWSANPYTLSFNATGGSSSEGSRTVNYGDSLGGLPTATRDYYTFAGWYTAENGGSAVSGSDVMGAGNMTIYAHWTENAWVTSASLPSEVSSNPGAYDVIENFEYRYRNKTTVNSQSEAGGDWTLIESGKTDTGTYTNWSNWSTSYVAGDQNEERTVYNYQTTTTSTDASVAGYTCTGVSGYTDWVNGGETSDATQSETRQLTSGPTYHYFHYCTQYYKTGGKGADSVSSGGTISSSTGRYHTITTSSQLSSSYIEDQGGRTDSVLNSSKCASGWYVYWPNGVTYTYQYRSPIYGYVSNDVYTSTSYPSGAVTNINAVTQYRYCNKVYQDWYTYWGSWSEWSSSSQAYDSSNTQEDVQSVGYTYRKK